MKILIVGKNSFLSKNLQIKDSVKISHQDIEKVNLNEFDKLILISFPPVYKKKRKTTFLLKKNCSINLYKKRLFTFQLKKFILMN